jgi:hypothetical protein
MLGRWRGLVADVAVKRFTEAKLLATTGIYFPTVVRPTGEVNGAAGVFGNEIESGLTPLEGIGVQLHEDAHVLWRDVLRQREPVVRSEYRADATAGYWMVIADLPRAARGAYIALLRSFGANQGDHGTDQGRIAAFQAGLEAGERDLREGNPQGTGLDTALADLGLSPRRFLRQGTLPYADAVALAYVMGR